MLYKTLRTISLIIIALTLLCAFAYSVHYVSSGGNKLGKLTKPIRLFSTFPETVYEAYEVLKSPAQVVKVDTAFKRVNHLTRDIYVLNSTYSDSEWLIKLMNLRNDSLVHQWILNDDNYIQGPRIFSRTEPRGPILLKDRSIVFSCDESNNLYRLDKNSNITWHNTDYHYHHSLNLGPDGNIWIGGKALRYIRATKTRAITYRDNSIININIETGEVLWFKSVTDLLVENGYSYLVYGMANGVEVTEVDPIHLNDIQPVLADGPFWKKGDLFLSLRNRSLVMLYRPSTNEIIRIIQGPFLSQHDVDIDSETRISVFNNNAASLPARKISKLGPKARVEESYLINAISSLVVYDFMDSTFTKPMNDVFISEGIYTFTEGLHTILSNGDVFIESQNSGKIYIFNDDEVLFRGYINKPVDNMVEQSNWARIYENINF